MRNSGARKPELAAKTLAALAIAATVRHIAKGQGLTGPPTPA